MSTKLHCTSVVAPDQSRESLLGHVEDLLSHLVSSLTPIDNPISGPGRPRILPSLALWAGMLVCVLHGFSSQLALWRLLTRVGLWFYPRFAVSDQAVYARLRKGGVGPLMGLFESLQRLLADHLAPMTPPPLAPFASEVVAIDETTLDSVARKLPALRPVPGGDHKLLPGKLAGVFDIRRQQWRSVQFIPDPNQNERVVAREMAGMLPEGTLILADLGYFGFAWFDWLTDHNYWWVSRLRAKTSYEIIHTFYQEGKTFDGIVWLGVHHTDHAAHAVRLVCFEQGGLYRQYVTNVRASKQLTMLEIAQLYARRWDIELAVLMVKRRLGLHLLWSGHEVIVQQQVFAVLIIAQVLQALRMEIAWKAGVDPFEVSMGLMIEYLPQFAAAGEDPIEAFVEHGREMGFIRPSRRIQVRGPTIPPEEIRPLPEGVALVRTPRYGQRRCQRVTMN